jgi:hypothetical protein
MAQASAKVMAGCFALAAFAVAILAGLAAGNAAVGVLKGAVIAMVVCYPVGLLAGLVCQRVLTAHVQAAKLSESAASSLPRGATDAPKSVEQAESEIMSA